MKKKVFALTMILGLIWGTMASAWQDPCLAIENEYTYEGYALVNWTPAIAMFSPAPKCEGTVLLLDPNGFWILLDYRSSGDKLLIVGIPCWLSNDGRLVCKVITQPEESYTFSCEQKK